MHLSFVLLLIVCATSSSNDNETIIVCQSETDYYQFLYRVCLASTPCRVLFYLSPPAVSTTEETYIRYLNEQDFELFRHQLTQYPLIDQENSTNTVLSKILPSEWKPSISLLIDENAGVACSNATTPIDPWIALTMLYAMHLYKTIVGDEYFCHHPNERLVLDADLQPYCLCKTGKSCDSESNFNQLYTFLQIVLVILIVILICATLGSIFYKRHLLMRYKLVSI